MVIYFDNSATSYPKPKEMLKAMATFTEKIGSNPGRAGHRLSVEGGRIMENTRELLAELFNIRDPLRISFTYNATYAINIGLQGLLNRGDHVITSSLEHNAIARTLNYLTQKGIEYTKIPVNPVSCRLNIEDIKKSIKKNTKIIAMLHGSNVTGTTFDLSDIGKTARENNLIFLVDTAQTAGCYPIDVEKNKIDILAFTGHKSLLGPQGTGGLYIRPGLAVKPIIHGGTGSYSENDTQPLFMPDAFESGTQNTVGLAGLEASLNFILKTGVEKIRKHEIDITRYLLKKLAEIPEIIIYGGDDIDARLPVFSLNIKGISPSTVGQILDDRFNIMSRIGLHCSPWAHQTIGTYPNGTIRFGLGFFNTKEEIDKSIKALKEIIRSEK